MPASSGMVLSTKVTVETITTDMEKNAHTCEQKRKFFNITKFTEFLGILQLFPHFLFKIFICFCSDIAQQISIFAYSIAVQYIL